MLLRFLIVLALALALPTHANAQSALPGLFGVGRPAGKTSGGGSSGITIGTTAITGGTSGGELFQTSGGKVGSDSGFTYAGTGGVLTLTPAANTAQPFLITGGSTTGSATAALGLSIVGTLNTSGVVDGAAVFANVTNTASGTGSLIIDLQAGSASVFSLGFDTPIVRDAAGMVGHRNGATAQSFRVYNTWTSSTSFEAGIFDWQLSTNNLVIGTQKGSGGGSVRNMNFIIGGSGKMDYGVTVAGAWSMSAALNVSGNVAVSSTSTLNLNAATNTGLNLASNLMIFWSSGAASGTGDTGLSRGGAAIVNVGNGTISDVSGTIVAAHGTFNALANSATTSAVCYNTSTGVLTYDSTIGTCTTSTRRVKHDIVPIADNTALLDGVLKMRPASFEYDASMRTPGEQLGLIAEDMAVIDSRLVAYDDEGKPIAIKYLGPLFAYLIGAIKQQQVEIDTLKGTRR